jgi:glycosyltransferase involved in cell wall biosynthesis
VRIYLLEPYFTGSHRQWSLGLRDTSCHDVHLITHEGQFWKWRLTGGFVTLAEDLAAAVAEHGPPDLVLASSMLDLAGFLGVARRTVGRAPAALYFHENQITYPEAGRTRAQSVLGLANWTSLVAANGVAFNSEFHREAFFDALPVFLGAFPDRRHDHLIPAARSKSAVVPVGVDLGRIGPLRKRQGPATFLWNHRWDPDKDVVAAVRAFRILADEGEEFRVILAGESFVGQAAEHREAIAALGDRVVHVGYLDDAGYLEALHSADAVVSTAQQEFFGVSIVEAMFAGALPVLPNRLVYPDRIPAGFEGECLYRTPGGMLDRLRAVARDPGRARAVAGTVRSAVAAFDWPVVGPRTDAWLESIG